MLARLTAMVGVVVGCFAVASQAAAHADPVLNGTYRLDYNGANRTINGEPSPTTDTSATYTFTSSCTGDGCTARAILLNSTDREPVSAHNPDLTLQFVDGAWTLSLPYDTYCWDGTLTERNQLLTWSLTPQDGDVLTGFRIVASPGTACPGDDAGALSQPMTATRVGDAASGILVP